MKKLICSIVSVLLVATVFVGCSKTKDRILYSQTKLSKYVDLCDYNGVKVDTKTDEFAEMLQSVIDEDVAQNDLYVIKDSGEVKDGDTVNIDYEGKKDGVAFDGGTAQGYDLTIGSGSFIDGFEDGLIGVSVGETVDLNLTFPEEYQAEDLAGKDVVFTVKVNYIKTTDPLKADEYYKDLGFESVEEYNADVKERAIKNFLLEKVTTDSKISSYPEEDLEKVYESYKKSVEFSITNQYGIDFATYLSYTDSTEEKFKEDAIANQVKPIMDVQIPLYAIFDNEKIKFDQEEIDEAIKESLATIGDSSVTADDLKTAYGEFYFEQAFITEKVLDYLYKNAKIS